MGDAGRERAAPARHDGHRTKGGQFDILTIGTYEVPIWAKQNWLVGLDKLPPDYDRSRPPAQDPRRRVGRRQALSRAVLRRERFDDQCIASTCSRKAGLTMRRSPTWDFVIDAAKKVTDKSAGLYRASACAARRLGREHAFTDRHVEFRRRARWFDEKWQPQFNTPEWKKTLTTYLDVIESGGSARRQLERLQREPRPVHAGKCGMWIDSTVAASLGTNPKESKAPTRLALRWRRTRARQERQLVVGVEPRHSGWLQKADAAAEVHRLGHQQRNTPSWSRPRKGWANSARREPAPRSTRNPEYVKAAPFAKLTLASIDFGRPQSPDSQAGGPMSALQYAAIPEFQGIGTTVGQQFSAALAGTTTLPMRRLAAAQASTEREMKRGRLHQVTEQTRALRPASADAGRRPAVCLDDRSAGDDDLFLDAALQPLNPGRSKFVGLENYTYFLTDPAFLASLYNTLLLVGSVLAITIVLGTLIALLLDQAVIGRSIVRLMVIAPFFVMPTVSALVGRTS